MLSRSIVALTAVAALALPATALAERGPGHRGQPFENAAQPSFTIASEPGSDTQDTSTTDATTDTTETTDTPAAGTEPASRPSGKRRQQGKRFAFGLFQNRVWRVEGEANGFDADRHALSIVVDNVSGLSSRLAARLEAALGEQADVLVSSRTRVIDADGNRVTGDDVATALEGADSVKVSGKLAPRKVWAEDEDGTPVPAFRALRIKIVG